MTPAARVSLNGKDVTEKWSAVLESVSVTDEAGIKADTCSITFDNRSSFSAPPIGAEIQVWIGYAPTPTYMGRYKIDSWSKSFPLKRLTVSAKAADLTSKIRAQKMRSFHEKTVKQIVEQIAGDHSLKAIVDADIGARMVEHIDQQTESDMSFLSRLAKRQGATFKVADGNIIFAAKGSKNAPSGKAKAAITLKPLQTSNLEASCNKRGEYKSASATYIDPTTKKRKTAKAGSGAPQHRDRRLYGSQAEALAAAKATLGDLTRGQIEITYEGPGDPLLFAEGLVAIKEFDADVDGEYLLKSVTHTYSGRGGYTTSASMESAGQATQSASDDPEA